MLFLEAYKKALAVISNKPLVLWGLSLLSGVVTLLASIFSAEISLVSVIQKDSVHVGVGECHKERNGLIQGFKPVHLR